MDIGAASTAATSARDNTSGNRCGVRAIGIRSRRSVWPNTSHSRKRTALETWLTRVRASCRSRTRCSKYACTSRSVITLGLRR